MKQNWEKDKDIKDIKAMINNSKNIKVIISQENLNHIKENLELNNSLKDLILNRRCDFEINDVRYQYHPYPLNIWRELKVQ